MKKVIFATGNQGKMKEIREILGDLDIELLSLKDAGIHADIVEDGKTFEENAQIKARTICNLTGEIVLADDSGLEIDYLNKSREFIPHVIWEKTLLTILKCKSDRETGGVRMKRELQDLSVRLRRHFRMER